MALIKVKSGGVDNTTNLGRRNLIINGAMQLWQRGTSTSALTHQSNIYHSVDRWSAVLDQNEGSGTLTTTFSQSTDVPSTEAFPYSLKAVVNSSSFTPSGSDCTALFSHSIETYNANPLGWGTSGAKQATLTYWIKSSVTGTGTLQLRLHDSSNVNGVADSQLYTKFTINQANTWEKKTHLIPANSTDGWRRDVSANAVQIYWFFGSNQAAAPTQDAWFRQNNYGQKHDDMTLSFQTTGGTAYLTGCQLEVGDTATPFEHRSYGEELELCQRYYEQGHFSWRQSGSIIRIGQSYQTRKRAAATVNVYYDGNKATAGTINVSNTNNSGWAEGGNTNFWNMEKNTGSNSDSVDYNGFWTAETEL